MAKDEGPQATVPGWQVGRPWNDQPLVYGVAFVIAVLLVVLFAHVISDRNVASAPTTTFPQEKLACRTGDPDACTGLEADTLEELCDDEVEVACAERRTRLAEASQSTSTTGVAGDERAPDEELCVDGDRNACFRLTDAAIGELCRDGVDGACAEVESRSEVAQFVDPLYNCTEGDLDACAFVADQELNRLCRESGDNLDYAPCIELQVRSEDL